MGQGTSSILCKKNNKSSGIYDIKQETPKSTRNLSTNSSFQSCLSAPVSGRRGGENFATKQVHFRTDTNQFPINSLPVTRLQSTLKDKITPEMWSKNVRDGNEKMWSKCTPNVEPRRLHSAHPLISSSVENEANGLQVSLRNTHLSRNYSGIGGVTSFEDIALEDNTADENENVISAVRNSDRMLEKRRSTIFPKRAEADSRGWGCVLCYCFNDKKDGGEKRRI